MATPAANLTEQKLGFQRLAIEHVFQSLAIEELHGDERLAFPFTNLMDGADVRMIQSRGGLRLALETGESLRICVEVFRRKPSRPQNGGG